MTFTPCFTDSPTAREVVRLVHAAPQLYLTTHITPDGDTIGSALGLYWGLRQLGKQVRVAGADPVPDIYQFLPGWELIKAQMPTSDELIVILDASDLQRLGSIYDESLYANRPLLNIDHHGTNLNFGTLNWIEPKAASTAEIMVELLYALGARLDANVATCLLTGITTDTLGFRTSATTPELMETAALLMQSGASLSDIIEQVFNTREVSDLQLQGMIFAALHVEDGLIWSDNTLAMRRAAGADEKSGTGSGNALLAAKRAKVSVMFIEKKADEIEVSFRARPGYDISQVAFAFGGGGHRQAAGCTLRTTLDEAHAQVLPAVRAVLATNDE